MSILSTLKDLYNRAVDLFDGDNNVQNPAAPQQQPQISQQQQPSQLQQTAQQPAQPTQENPWLNFFKPKSQEEKDKQIADEKAAKDKADAAKAAEAQRKLVEGMSYRGGVPGSAPIIPQIMGGITQGYGTNEAMPEDTSGRGKFGNTMGRIGHFVVEDLIRPGIIEPQKQLNKNIDFYHQNEANLPKNFQVYDNKGSDWTNLDNIGQLYQQKNAIINNPNYTTEQKMPAVNAIQDEITAQAIEMSHGNIKNVPSPSALEEVSKNYQVHKADIDKMWKEDIMGPTSTEIKEAKTIQTIQQDNFNKIIAPMTDAILQGRTYRGAKLEGTDIYPIANKFITDSNIDNVLSKPYVAKQMAEELLAKAKTDTDKKYYQKKIDDANAMIKNNDEKVIPYVRYMIVNLGLKGNSINELTNTYLSETKQSIQDIMGEKDNLNAITSGIAMAPVIAVKGIKDSVAGGPQESLNKALDSLKLNRGDVAQQDINEMKFKSGNVGQKLLEGVGITFSKAENLLNTMKGMTYLGGPAGVLGRMDMESLANIDSQIAPPQGWGAKTWEGFKNFTRRGIQMGPELAAQIVPFLVGAGEIGTLEKGIEATRLAKGAQIAAETARIIKSGKNIAEVAQTAGSPLAKLLGKALPEYLKLIEGGKTPIDAINMVSKGNYVTEKLLLEPAKLLVNNYLMSGALQGHNPKAYTSADFRVDTVFTAIDAVVDVSKVLKHYGPDSIKYNQLFTEGLSKKLWDIPDKKWLTLSANDQAIFNEMTDKYMQKYNNAMGKYDAAKLKQYVQAKIDSYKRIPIDKIIERSKTIAAGLGDTFELTTQFIRANNLVPSYITDTEIENILKHGKSEADNISMIKKLSDSELVGSARGKRQTTRQRIAQDLISDYITAGKYSKEPSKMLGNMIEDIDHTFGQRGKVTVDGTEYSYERTSQNLKPKKGEQFKSLTTKPIKSEGKFQTTRYLLFDELAGETIQIDPKTGYRYVADAAGKPISDKDRMLTFFKNFAEPGEYWGTLVTDKVGKQIDNVEKIIKHEELPTSTAPVLTANGIDTTKNILTQKKIAGITYTQFTTTQEAGKLFVFSTLNDALKKSNIDNNGFELTKPSYTFGDEPLWKALKDAAAKTFGGGYALSPEMLAEVKRFAYDTVDKFYPQYPELKNMIDSKLRNLSYEPGKLKGVINKTLSALGLERRGGNDVAVLSNLAGDGGLGEFMKFFDRDGFQELRDNMDKFKDFFKVDFPDQDWNRYRTLWKYIGNDHNESRIAKFFQTFLGADVYRIGQTIVNVGGMPKMLVMNSMAWVTETMRKYNIKHFTNSELYDLRQKYNILYTVGDYEQKLAKDMMDVDATGLAHTMNLVGMKASELYKSGFYNAADIFYSKSIRNQSLGQAIEEFLPQFAGPDAAKNLDKYLQSIPETERLNVLKTLQSRSEEILNKRTGQYTQFWKGKVTFDSTLPDFKQALYRTYSLMGSRGMGMMKSSLETIGQAFGSKLIRGTFGKRYLEKLETLGKLEADKRALDYVSKSDDFGHLIQKMSAAIGMGFKQNRLVSDNDGQKDFITTLREGYELGKNYSFPIQAFESNPFGRAALAFIYGVLGDVDNDGRINFTGSDFKKAGLDTAKQIINDFFRRASLFKATIGGVSETVRDGKPQDVLSNIFSSFQKATGGYLYYSTQEVTNNGFDLYTPLTNKSYLQGLIPYTDPFVAEYRKMSGNVAMQKLIEDPKNYLGNRLLYNLPLIKDRKLGQFQDEAINNKVVGILGQDDFFQNHILKGEIDWNTIGDDGKQYAYYQLTNMGSYGSKANPQAWFDDMRKNFNFTPTVTPGETQPITNPDGTVTWPARQNQEDLFVELMKDSMQEGDWNQRLKLFNESVKGNQKGAVQMLAFAEANTPGAGKEMLANIVSSEWGTMMGDINGAWVNGKPDPTISKQVESYLGEKYGDLMYITDKPMGWKNMSLFYARAAHPELQSSLSDPYDKAGRPSKDINFVYEKTDTGTEKPYKNSVMNQVYAMDLMAKIEMASGNPDGFKLSNAFATLWMPKGSDNASIEYNGLMLKGLNNTLNYVTTSHLSEESKVEMKKGIFVGLYNKLSVIAPTMSSSIYKDEFMETMRFLHGTVDGTVELAKEQGAKQYFKDEYGTSFGNSNYYSAKEYPAYSNTSTAMRNLSYLFSPYRNYGTSKSYGSKYYTAKERDYLVAYGKGIGTGVARISDFSKGIPREQEPSGRTPSQKGGSARPFTKREDPDKPIDFTTVTTMKRKLSRKAIKYDNSGVRKSGLGGGLYNVSYQGGNRKRRVSRPKGGDAKGSTKYYKTSR